MWKKKTEIDNPFYSTSEASLEPHEIKKLKNGYIIIPIFFVLFAVFFYFIFNVEKDVIWQRIIFGFMLFFAAIMFIIVRGFYLDLKHGTKEITKGVITHKKIEVSRGTRARSAGARGISATGGSKTKWYYYIFFGEKRMRVEGHIYDEFSIGDRVEIHHSKRLYNMVYKTIVLEHNVMMDKIAELKEEREKKEKKYWWLGITIFILLSFVVLNIIFFSIADCFNCPPEYSKSIEMWENIPENEIQPANLSAHSNTIVSYLADTLKDEEEAIIYDLFKKASDENKLNELILELSTDSVQNKSVLNWMQLKFDEEYPAHTPLTVMELWKRTLRVFNLRSASGVFQEDRITYFRFNQFVLENKFLNYNALDAWIGNVDVEEKKFLIESYSKRSTNLLSPGLEEYLKKTMNLIPSQIPSINDRKASDY